MKPSTAYNHQQRAVKAIDDIYRRAVIFKTDSIWIREMVNEVHKSIKHCPRHVQSYVSGYERRCYEDNWKNLEFCYFINGKWQTTDKTSKRKKAFTGKSLSGAKCAFLWKDSQSLYTEEDTVD
jgi:hypothetical protein